MKYKAILFDLDGVIADTAVYHFASWCKIANSLGFELEPEFEEQLKGVDRVESLNRVLSYGNISVEKSQFDQLIDDKNNDYLNEISKLTPADILPGIKQLLIDLKENEITCIVASASKNAPYILEKLMISDYFLAIANPSDIKNGKPAPDIFLEACRLSNFSKHNCLGIEDAQAGIDALNAAGIDSIAVGDLEHATHIVDSTTFLTYEYLVSL